MKIFKNFATIKILSFFQKAFLTENEKFLILGILKKNSHTKQNKQLGRLRMILYIWTYHFFLRCQDNGHKKRTKQFHLYFLFSRSIFHYIYIPKIIEKNMISIVSEWRSIPRHKFSIKLKPQIKSLRTSVSHFKSKFLSW